MRSSPRRLAYLRSTPGRHHLGLLPLTLLPWVRLAAVFLLLPLLLSACLTTKGQRNTSNLRGLTASEAEQLQSLHNPDWRYPLRPPERQETFGSLAETAELMLQSGNYEQSIYNYSKILFQHPERHDIRYKLALALLFSGHLEEARRELAQVLSQQPDHVEAHEALGCIFLEENKPAEAQQEFHTVLTLNPQRAQARALLGEVYLTMGQYAKALTECQAALTHNPKNAAIMSNIGWIHYHRKNYDEALRWLRQAQGLKPQHPRINQRLGMVLAAQKKYPEALEAFRRGGDDAQAFNNIGVYYYLDGRYQDAARFFQKALDLRPVYYEEAKVNLDKALAKLQLDQAGRVMATTPMRPQESPQPSPPIRQQQEDE